MLSFTRILGEIRVFDAWLIYVAFVVIAGYVGWFMLTLRG
jgi:hypothetical protein